MTEKCELCGRSMVQVLHRAVDKGRRRKHWHCKKCGIWMRRINVKA